MTAAPLLPPPVAPAGGEPRGLEDRFLKVEWKAVRTDEKVLIALRIRTARAHILTGIVTAVFVDLQPGPRQH